MEYSCNYGRHNVVKYLHETVGAKCTEDHMEYSCNYGFLEIVKYLHENI